MHLIPVIGLIALLLGVPIQVGAQPATPAAASPIAASGDFAGLAAHFFGGLVVRLYASTYPDEVVGLVLIDAAQEDYYEQQRAVLTPAQWAAFTQPPKELGDYPDRERLDPDAALEAVWLPLQEKLAALVPDSRLVVAEQSRHYIPGDQPDLVIDAIRQVVAAVRDPSTWATHQATPTV